MSMTDLFGSDVDESEEEESSNIKEKSADISGESEQSVQEEDDDNDHDDNDREEDEEEEEEQEEVEMKEKSDEESNEEPQEQQDEVEENHVIEEEDEEQPEQDSEKEEPSESHKNVSSMDLFGEELSSEEDEVPQEKERSEQEKDVSEHNENDHQRRFLGSDGEEEEEDKPEEETQINVEIPYSKFSLGSDISFVKLPNFLSIETKPFLPSHYEDEIEEDELLDEEGRARMKLRVENTIRWRRGKDEDGNEIKESNARFVKWSDNTMSLLLGGEIFDIHKTKIDGEHNHLFVQQGTGLQAQAIFHEKLTFRPHSTNSQTHRKMTLSIADRVSKAGKIKILPVVGKDPESKKGELIKKEEEKLRAQLRRENQQRRMREKSHARGLTASYLEPDRYDDDEDVLEQSLLEMKKQYKKGIAKGRLGEMYSDQESEEEGISGGLESDDESGENSTEKKLTSFSEDDISRSRKHSFEEGGSTKKKRKVIESDEDESD